MNKSQPIKQVKISIFLLIFALMLGNQNQTSYAKNDIDSPYEKPTSPTDLKNIKFDHITLEDGLLNAYVLDILQDKYGFIWILGETTLTRYDGNNFKEFLSTPGENNIEGYYYDILEDKNGNIWVCSSGGVGMYDQISDEFITYEHDPDDPNSLSSYGVKSLYIDSEDILWIGMEDAGLNSLNLETKEITHYSVDVDNPDSINHSRVNKIFEDSKGVLWVGTNGGGLNVLDRDSGKFSHYTHDPHDDSSISANVVKNINEDSKGNLWIATGGGGLNKFDRDSGKFTHFIHDPNDETSLNGDHINAIFEDSNGILWVGSYGGGLNIYNYETDSFIGMQHQDGNPNSIISNNVFTIMEDDSGIIWICFNGGISKYDPNGYDFGAYSHQPNNPNSLGYDFTWGFAEDKDGYIWIALLGGGIDRFDPRTEEFIHFRADPEDPDSISFDAVQQIYVDSENTLWLCSEYFEGLDRMDLDTWEITNFNNDPNNPNSLSDGSIWEVRELEDGTFWIATMGGGLNLMDRETGEFTRYTHDTENPTSISGDYVTALYEDSDGDFWIGTAVGLNILNKETGEFTRFHYDPDDETSIGNDFVTDILETRDGNIWIATWNGINRYNKEDNSFSRFYMQQGLPYKVSLTMLEDDDGYLWVSTYGGGLAKLNTETEEFIPFTEGDGLQSNVFSTGHLVADDGKLYFGGQNGFNSFRPDEILDNSYIPTIVLTDFQIFNQEVDVGTDSVLSTTINHAEEIILDYTESLFSIEFAALHYSNPESHQYAYMLEGYDEDWIYTTSEYRRVTYMNLDGGDYTFKVKGTNSHGVWNEEGRSLNITITPPWWETNLFRISAILIIAGAVMFGVRYRLRASEQRQKELEILVDERTKELHNAQAEVVQKEKLAVLGRLAGSVSHELRNPLGVITNSIYFLRNAGDSVSEEVLEKYYDIINYEADISTKIITDLLDYGRNISADLERTKISNLISKCFDRVPPPEGRNIELVVDIQPEDITATFDPMQMELAIKNIFDNAYQAMDSGGTLKIVSFIEGDEIVLKISDTGTGIPEEHIEKIFQPLFSTKIRGFGLGLSVSKKYVEANKGRIFFESVEDEGTTFIIYLPK